MLYKRYPNPMPLLDGMISTGRFTEFVYNLVNKHNKEMEEKTLWECWLYKVQGKSFKEFRDEIAGRTTEENAAPPQKIDIEKTMKASYDMLSGFSIGGGLQNEVVRTSGDNSG